MILSDIVGQLHAKRAIEIAWAGGHSITLIGHGNASLLATWCHEKQIAATAIKRCYCGHYPGVKCQCTPAQVTRWQSLKRWGKAMQADIVIECYTPTESDITDWHARQWPTDWGTDEAMATRITDIQHRPPIVLNDMGRTLLKAARSQLQFSEHRINRTLAVAQTVAALAHQNHIGCAHLAEAIQYRPGRNFRLAHK